MPTGTTVAVKGATIALPWLRYTRADDQPGTPAVRLEQYLRDAPIVVDAATIDAHTQPSFALPPATTERPAALRAGRASGSRSGRRLAVRLVRRGRGLVAYGSAPSGWRVTVGLVRGGRTVARRTATARYRAFRISIPRRPPGRYVAIVTARKGATTLRTRSRAVRVR